MISASILDKRCLRLDELDMIYNSEHEDMEFPWLSDIRQQIKDEYGARVLTIGHRAMHGNMHSFTIWCYSEDDWKRIPRVGSVVLGHCPEIEEMIRKHFTGENAKIMCRLYTPCFLIYYKNRLIDAKVHENRGTVEEYFAETAAEHLCLGSTIECVLSTKTAAAEFLISEEYRTIRRRIYTFIKMYDKYDALSEEDIHIFVDYKEHFDKTPMYGRWVADMNYEEYNRYEKTLIAEGLEKSCREKAERMVAEMTPDEKLGLLSTHHNAVERLGMGEFYIGTEVARGFVGREPEKYSTVFPQPTGLAATFDRELLRELGKIAGTEARAYYNREKKGGLMLWGPTVDMERDPRWGRTEEAYGEDVCLTGELTAAYTLGMADISDDGYYLTVPTLKHFCADNNEEDRGSCDAYLPLRLKYEYYYAAFEHAIRRGGARSVMAAYNEINGIPAIMNDELNDVLKEQWGLWFTVSDGGDFTQNVTSHRFCKELSEAYRMSLTAGCDTMTDSEAAVKAAAEKALEKGIITWADIDRSIVNTVTARLLTGNIGGCSYDDIGDDVIDCEAHREINLRAAEEQIVLLKNEDFLPIKEKPEKIAVVGALADEMLRDWYTGYYRDGVSVLDGIRKEFPDAEVIHDSLWDKIAIKAPNDRYLSVHEDGSVKADADVIGEAETFELQDWGENWKNLFSVKYRKYIRLDDDGTLKLHNRTIYDWFTHETFNLFRTRGGVLIEEYLGHKRMSVDVDGNISFVNKRAVTAEQVFSAETVSSGKERAAEIAESVPLVIYCTGNYPVQTAKECYDRRTLALNVQAGMAAHLWESNNNTVMVLISGYPYAINDENTLLPAIIYSTHAGAHLGTAVAETLTGKNVPSGRLPMTWYRSEHELPDILNYDIETAGTTYMYFEGKPLYPFGYGLSYSEFEYGNMKAELSGSTVCVTADVTNISDTDGTEVVQVYFTLPGSAVKRAPKKLGGFERVFVKAGETVTAKISVPFDILRIYDVRSERMLVENGKYRLSAGSSSADFRTFCDIDITTDNGVIGGRPSKFDAVSFEECSNVRIYRNCVRPTSWNGTVIYRGIDLSAGAEVKVHVSSIIGREDIIFETGGQKTEAKVPPGDSYDDFKKVTVYIDPSDSDELKITIAEGMYLSDIEIIQ